MIEYIKSEIAALLKKQYPFITPIVEEPKDASLGDISIPIFELAKKRNVPFDECKSEVETLLRAHFKELITDIRLVRGFINIDVNKELVASHILMEITKLDNNYGTLSIGKDKTVVIDYSSPNIAKPFSVGHLRSTIIGHALGNLYEKCGYKVVRINHLGDWGTQFGKLIVAYQLWGDKNVIDQDPINELVKLYVKFNELEEHDPELTEKARHAFKELENGNEAYLKLWKWFKEESLKEFIRMYDRLGVYFDYYLGESFYTDKMDAVIKELEDKELLVFDDGAYVVLLDDLVPALIKKSDGTSLYITRDLAALFYRKKTYDFNKILYVIGNEQALHIAQLKAVVKKMGYDFYDAIEHINFGLVLQDGKKMSTRKGRIVRLEEVLDEACLLAKTYIENKNPNLPNKEEVAEKVGVSAIIFNDLKNHRVHNIEFDLEKMLQFEGETGPYLQYTSVRINSILKQVASIHINVVNSLFNKSHYFEVIRILDKFPLTLEKTVKENDPSILSKYLLSLATSFNKFYSLEKILVPDELIRNTNVLLSRCVKVVLDEGMRLLGMQVIDEM